MLSHITMQHRVLDEAPDLVMTVTEPGEIRELPIKWAKVRREAKGHSRQSQML